MGEVCFQSFFVCDFFSLFCQTKEDSEEEEVEEVVYKDSSHFLKVFIFYMYVLPIYKMYNFQFNNFHHLRKKGVKSQDITIIFKPYYHYTNTQDKSYHFKPKATSSFRTLFILCFHREPKVPTHIMTTASILLILDKGLITSSEMLVSN